MNAEPPPPARSQRSQPGAEARPEALPEPTEHYGIVSISRHVKDDGRALLLFTREAQDER
jgi:hypothetical protein